MGTVDHFDGLLAGLTGCAVTQHSVAVDGCVVNYMEAGAGTPLVLIHGLNIGWGQWYQNIAELARHFRVLAINLPGSGQNSGPQYREFCPGAYRAIVSNFVRHLKLDACGIIGHSFGSTLALYAAIDCPKQVAKVVLTGPLALSAHLPSKHRLVARRLVAHGLAHTVMRPTPANLRRFLHGAVAQPQAIPKPLVDYYASWIAGDPRRHPFLFMSSLSDGASYREGVTLLPHERIAVTQPVLVIAGSEDAISPLPEINPVIQEFPQAKLEVFQAIGHVPNLEAPERFNMVVQRFMGAGS